MRIAMISEHASPLAALGGVDAGGQNVHVAALARGLARRGHQVEVFTRREDESSPERVELAPGATVVHVPAGPPTVLPKDDLLPYMEEFGRWVRDEWKRTEAPDVVHAHFWMSGLAALSAGRACGVPVVQTFHALGTVKRRFQGAEDSSPADRLRLERDIAHDVDRIIATCTDEVAELRAMGVSPERVRVIPCGVDTARFHPAQHVPRDAAGGAAVAGAAVAGAAVAGDADPRAGDAAAGRPGGGRRARLLLVGRMVPRKGFDTAIRALALLPDAELVIAGGPTRSEVEHDPEARRLMVVAQEAGVADRVVFLGQVAHADMPEVYRSVDVVLATPWYEPFGITPLEAAASGRPLVGSAVGGLLDSVADGVTGRLVQPRDPRALADAVRGILADPVLASRYGAEGRVRALERFDWDIVSAATEQALTELVEEVRAANPHRQTECDPARLAPVWLDQHEEEFHDGLAGLRADWSVIQQWGEELATSLLRGGRLLAAGNGGSAAEAQHLTGELVGRFLRERRPFSAISLHAESSSFTAILNDYGPDEVFARQVEGHGRPGDVLMLLSTSGASSNVLHAAKRGHELGLQVWAMTGPAPNPLASIADSALAVPAASTAAVQEIHLLAVHALCAAFDQVLASRDLLRAAVPAGGLA
ncbi:MAG: glycosyltransferase [Intrasporangium sp.]|uniref:glycosyltransferase n=1 Tax=Intrasporangium sp. TaxID=1925024 RepID=UPI003F7ED1D6